MPITLNDRIPENLKDLINSRKLFDVVKFSVELGVYEDMVRPATLEDISGKTGMDPVFTRHLLNALSAFGYVERTEKDGVSFYGNTAVSELYLNRGSASYLGDDIFSGPGTYEALRKYVEEGPEGTAITNDYWSPELLKNIGSFALLGQVQTAVYRVDLAGRKKMLDVGGGHGLYSIFFTRKYPELKSWVLDLPGVIAAASENIKKYGAEERVRVIQGDFHSLDRGRAYDAVFISNVTASYDELCRLLSEARGLLSPGGKLILRNYVNDARADDWSPLVVLDRFSRRGRQGFSTAQLKAALESSRLADIRLLYEGDGVAILCGIGR